MKKYIRAAINPIENEPLYIRRAFADSPDASPRELANLANDSNRLVVCDVAKNPNTPKDILSKLSESSDPSFRANVARNPAITYDIAQRLVLDPDQDVLRALAKNCSVSSEILNRLASISLQKHKDIVAIAVFENPNTDQDTREKLRAKLKDSYADVYVNADAHTGEVLTDEELDALEAQVATNPLFLKYGLREYHVVNDYNGEDYHLEGEFTVNLVLNLITNDEFNSIVSEVTSIVEATGSEVTDWCVDIY